MLLAAVAAAALTGFQKRPLSEQLIGCLDWKTTFLAHVAVGVRFRMGTKCELLLC